MKRGVILQSELRPNGKEAGQCSASLSYGDSHSGTPIGYYDIYVASFTLNGVKYEIEAQRLELEEVVKIAASIINVPYNENFTVGNIQSLPDTGNVPAASFDVKA